MLCDHYHDHDHYLQRSRLSKLSMALRNWSFQNFSFTSCGTSSMHCFFVIMKQFIPQQTCQNSNTGGKSFYQYLLLVCSSFWGRTCCTEASTLSQHIKRTQELQIVSPKKQRFRNSHCASILLDLQPRTPEHLFDIALSEVRVSRAYGSVSSAGDEGKYKSALASAGSSPDTPRPILGESAALETKPRGDEFTWWHSIQQRGMRYGSW